MEKGFKYRPFDDLELMILVKIVQEKLAICMFYARDKKCLMHSEFKHEVKIYKRLLRTLINMQK